MVERAIRHHHIDGLVVQGLAGDAELVRRTDFEFRAARRLARQWSAVSNRTTRHEKPVSRSCRWE
jgi:hypothetical protein